MGNCAALFYTTDADQQTLHRRVRPSDEQLQSQQEYWSDLADYLKDDLGKRTSTTVTHWLQGSYKFGTQIRPAAKAQQFDIDLGVYFDPGRFNDLKHSASDLKAHVQASMAAYAADPQTDALRVEPPKEFCSRVTFSEDFHIDVPAYRHPSPELASQTKGFVESDPRALYDWWVNAFASDAQRDRARRVVRYLKMWAALKYKGAEKPPSSILMTVAVAEAFKGINEATISGDDELFVAAVANVSAFLRESRGNVSNPVNGNENLNRMGDAFDRFVDDLDDLHAIGLRALASGTQREAAETWAEAFQHFFPLPAELTVLAEASAVEIAQRNLIVPEVRVEIALPGGRSLTQLNGALNVPKGSSLNFRLENYGALPQDSQVIWTVRNQGSQAEAVNDLGHFSAYGPTAGPEEALYHGRHYMDVVIKQGGRTIGMRRIPVSVINTDLRPRSRRLFRNRRR
jgi:hypothetical protein